MTLHPFQKSRRRASTVLPSLVLIAIIDATVPRASADPQDVEAIPVRLADSAVRRCFARLYENAAFGLDETERAAWIIHIPGGFGCIDWPSRGSGARRVAWTAAIPPNVGWVHTHPHHSKKGRCLGTFSQADKRSARKFHITAYMLDRGGIWKFDPATNQVTREAGPHWFDRDKPARTPFVRTVSSQSLPGGVKR